MLGHFRDLTQTTIWESYLRSETIGLARGHAAPTDSFVAARWDQRSASWDVSIVTNPLGDTRWQRDASHLVLGAAIERARLIAAIEQAAERLSLTIDDAEQRGVLQKVQRTLSHRASLRFVRKFRPGDPKTFDAMTEMIAIGRLIVVGGL